VSITVEELEQFKEQIEEHLDEIQRIALDNNTKISKRMLYLLIFSTGFIDDVLGGKYQSAHEDLEHIEHLLEKLAEEENVPLCDEEE